MLKIRSTLVGALILSTSVGAQGLSMQPALSGEQNAPAVEQTNATQRILREQEKIEQLLQRYERKELAKMVLERDAWLEDANIGSVAGRVRLHIDNTLEALAALRVNGRDVFATVSREEKTPDGRMIWFAPERARQVQIQVQALEAKSVLFGVYGLSRAECLRLTADALSSSESKGHWSLSAIGFGSQQLTSEHFEHARSQIVPSKAQLLRWQNAQGEAAQRALQALLERTWDPCGKMYESDAWTLRFERTQPLHGSVMISFEPLVPKR